MTCRSRRRRRCHSDAEMMGEKTRVWADVVVVVVVEMSLLLLLCLSVMEGAVALVMQAVAMFGWAGGFSWSW